MPYGIIKIDTITFTDAGVDKSVSVSGLVQNPTFTGNVTATGTISGLIVQAPTVTGTTANFASGVYTTQISGAIVKVPAGSAGAPSIQVGVGASVAPGLYSPGTDQLTLNTGGVGRLFIASDGRVGVGAANVTGGINLEVIGSAPTLRVTGTSASNAKFELVSVGATLWSQICSGSDGSLSFNRDGTERLRIDSSGNVGIGTSSPTENLTVYSSAARLAVTGPSSLSAILLGNQNSGGVNNPAVIGAANGELYFGGGSSWSGGGTFDYNMFISDAGNVGIGTLSPGSKVVINDPGTGLSFTNAASGNFNIGLLGGVVSAEAYIYQRANAPLILGTNNTERLRIDSSGNVAIGTTNVGYGVVGIYNSLNSTIGIANATSYSQLQQNSSDLYINCNLSGAAGGNIIFRNGSTSTERLRIDSSGNVGIGTSSPGELLEVSKTASGTLNGEVVLQRLRSNTSNFVFLDIKSRRHTAGSDWTGVGLRLQHQVDATLMGFLEFNSTNNGYDVALGTSTVAPILFKISNTEAARFDSNGRLLVGSSTARSLYGQTGVLQTEGTGYASSGVNIILNNASTAGPLLMLGKSRGSVNGSNTIVQNNDTLGEIYFCGADGTDLDTPGASIRAVVDGAPGNNDMPCRLEFCTTADGASTPTERMRISQNGNTLCRTNANNNNATLTVYSDSTAGFTDSIVDVVFAVSSPNNTTARFAVFRDTTIVRAEIRSDGGLANFQANNVNLSDINTKKDITPADGTWDCLKQWEIVNYRYNDQPDDTDLNLGVIAQQVAESCPEVITVFQEAKEAKDAVLDEDGNETEPAQEAQPERLGIKEQQMYWMAIKALQEAQARIETLEAKVAALEGN